MLEEALVRKIRQLEQRTDYLQKRCSIPAESFRSNRSIWTTTYQT